MGLHARVSVITLGVADVPRARDFYQALGWPLSGAPQDGVAFFKNAGSRLALYSREAMAEAGRRQPHPARSASPWPSTSRAGNWLMRPWRLQ